MLREKSVYKYGSLLSSIGSLFEQARKQVVSNINTLLVQTYRQIGKYIIEFQQNGKIKSKYGSGLLSRLSKDLTEKYGKGFSQRNLEQMRLFYSLFQKTKTLSAKLSWSHYCLIMRLDDELSRKFYIVETEQNNRSVRELDRQINSMLFERLVVSKDKKSIIKMSEKGQILETPIDIIKDPYILEFLDLPENHIYSEKELESKLIDNLQKFLLELGKGFTFVQRQKRFTLDGDNYYVDLVFYNRLLKCFVLIDLKIGKVKHQDLGQMQMYVNYFDRKIKESDENSTIGILLCSDKKETTVEYTLPAKNKQIFASKYKLYLPDKEVLKNKIKEIIGD